MNESKLALTDMEKNPLHLWCARPDHVLTEETAEACAALLSQEELKHWQRFRFDRHRREYMTTHVVVRTMLAHFHPIPPEAWRFKLNAHGKPSTDPECGLRFNLSNCPGLVVCLIANGSDVGVDAEPCERAGKILELAPGVFSPLEIDQLEELRGKEKLDRALSLWTLKEAYIKARGMGLSIALQKFSFLFGGEEGIRLVLDPSLDDEPERWQFCLLDYPGHRIALMAEQATYSPFDSAQNAKRIEHPALQIWEAQALPAQPRRVPGGEEVWYPRGWAAHHGSRK